MPATAAEISVDVGEVAGRLVLGVPSLAACGLTAESVPEVVEMGRRASSVKANPIELTADELAGILEAAS